MNYFFTFITLSLTLLVVTACMGRNDSTLPPGQYQQTSKSVDASGTKRTTDRSTDVYYDENGRKKVKTDKKTTTDPKGLFNKSTTEQHDVVH